MRPLNLHGAFSNNFRRRYIAEEKLYQSKVKSFYHKILRH